MNGISTHVLDTTCGRPAAAVPVRLDRADASGNWLQVATSKTDGDGRCAQLLPGGSNLQEGNYRLTFGTEEYFSAQGIHGLYPIVQITFHVRTGEAHFHIPLLLSPNGYTTYRGT